MEPVTTLIPNSAVSRNQPSDIGLLALSPDSAFGNETFSVTDFWRTLKKRKNAVLLTCVGIVLATLVISLLMTPKYEAVGRVNINRENTDLLGLDDGGGLTSGSSDGLDYGVAILTQVSVLKSDVLARQVIREMHLDQQESFLSNHPRWSALLRKIPAVHSRPAAISSDVQQQAALVERFQKDLDVKPVAGTRVVEIHFRNADPKLAADVVNTLVSDYLELNFRTKFDSTQMASDWLSKQLEDLKKQVEVSQEKLVAYQKQFGILGTDENHNIITVKLEALNAQLTIAESSRIMKQAVYEQVRHGDVELIAGIGGGSIMTPGTIPSNTLSQVQQLRLAQSDLRNQYAQAINKFGPAYPKVSQLKSQLTQIDSSIKEELSKVSSRIENDYRAALSAEQLLRGRFDQQKDEANALNDSAIKYTILKGEWESGRLLYEGMLKKLKEAGVLAGLRATNIQIVDPATVPAKVASPNILLNFALSLLGGLFLGIVVALGQEGMDNTIRTTDHVEQLMGLSTLGYIPSQTAVDRVAKRKSLPLAKTTSQGLFDIVSLTRPSSEAAESYRALRSSILLASAGAQTKTIVVTSALPGEGKSTTSINVAVVLAQQGARVLLIDADMRRPTIHKQFGKKTLSGLSTFLTVGSKLQPLTFSCPDLPQLSVLPAGMQPRNPAELLGSARMKELLATATSEFDYIVIDTPPVLSVTDSVVVAAQADLVLLVARSSITPKQALLRARNTLWRANCRLGGVVLNDVDVTSPDHYYYSGHYYSQNEYCKSA